MKPLRQAIIAIGSNLGDRRQNLSRARKLLEETASINLIATSSLYETEPIGVTDQPAFLNGAIAVETDLDPERLMLRLLAIEKELGRIRNTRWGPRTIDLDLLFYENEIRETEELTLPHPRWKERSFVTIPLREILNSQALSNDIWIPLRKELETFPLKAPGVRRID